MKGKRIALTGGIATGKSTVAKMFSELGAIVIDADMIAREVVQPGEPCWHQLRQLLGESYFHRNGQLKRRELRERIVEDEACRSRVNAILHPAILETMNRMGEEWQDKFPDQIIIFDVPLLFELGLHARFDLVILVYAPPDIQVDRLMTRDGLTRHDAEKTLAMQYPIESKKSQSQIVVDNTLDQDRTYRQVKAIWHTLEDELSV